MLFKEPIFIRTKEVKGNTQITEFSLSFTEKRSKYAGNYTTKRLTIISPVPIAIVNSLNLGCQYAAPMALYRVSSIEYRTSSI